MSKAKKAKEINDNYLQHVELKNYKSIKELSVDFKPGLNIIIGGNGSGKTNLLSALNNVLSFNYQKQPDTESRITTFVGGNKSVVTAKTLEEGGFNDRQGLDSHLVEISINDKENIKYNFSSLGPDFRFKTSLSFNHAIINYGNVYLTDTLINIPLTSQLINNGRISTNMLIDANLTTFFLEEFFMQFYNFIRRHYKSNIENENFMSSFKENIINFSGNIFYILNDALNTYSPIKEIRLSPDFNLIEEADRKISISNLYLEFNINGVWLPFSFLSDGTKRLFYIISEFVELENKDKVFDIKVLGIRLLEEPELGIHPHQLDKLMLFLKEQSREKQIIITTHSPQVLDVLNSDELDKIIICDYDKEKGTQLHHLDDAQIKKAKLYMKKTFLSDYWRFSDLEPA